MLFMETHRLEITSPNITRRAQEARRFSPSRRRNEGGAQIEVCLLIATVLACMAAMTWSLMGAT